MTPQALSLLVTCKPNGRLVRVIEGSPFVFQHESPSSLLHVIDAADVDAYKRFMQTLHERGCAFDAALAVRTQQGVRPMHFAGVTGDGVLWVAAAQDEAVVLRLLAQAEREIHRTDARVRGRSPSAVLDELTAVNNELVNLQRELAQRNAALVALTVERNQLLGIAAHDLRNPIMVVQSYCELLRALALEQGRAARPQASAVRRACRRGHRGDAAVAEGYARLQPTCERRAEARHDPDGPYGIGRKERARLPALGGT